MIRKTLLMLAFIFGSFHAWSQVKTGIYSYGSFDTPGIDSIDRGSLNVHLAIPIVNKAGRGMPFYYNLDNDSSVWSPASTNGSLVWTPGATFGWMGDTEAAMGYISYLIVNSTYKSEGEPGTCRVTTYENWVYHDAFGVSHAFDSATLKAGGADFCEDPIVSFVETARDGSGYTLSVNGYTTTALTSREGKALNVPVNNNNGAGTVTDTNGNQITTAGNGVFEDTTGANVFTIGGSGTAASPRVFSYLTYDSNPNNTSPASASVTVTYKTYTVQTAFGCSGIGEYNQSTDLTDRITLADGSFYQFAYEPTPGNATNVTGRLASITLPTGGTISYTYTGGSNGINCADGSTTSITRTTTDGTRTYVRSAITTTSSQTAVTDGLGNVSTFNFVTAGSPTAFYETNRANYSGAASGTPLLSRQTCYNGSASPCTATAVTLPIAQIDTYETLDGVQQHGATAKYNAYGLQTEQDTYDFGGASARGNLLRKEVWVYPTSGIVSLVSSDTVTDGSGNQLSQTTYGYDQSAVTATSGLPQHGGAVGAQRGNLTTTTQWNNNGASVTTTSTYEDTGNPLTTTTPNGQSTYAYDAATHAFVTTATPPTPSSGVSLPTSATNDAASGLPLTTTDPNGAQVVYKTYDALLRPTEVDALDSGGKTAGKQTTLYRSFNQTGILHYQNASSAADTEILVDGYGRTIRAAVLNGQAASPWYQQDSCFDAGGNLHFTSYPYQAGGWEGPPAQVCSGAGDTYSYDALGRILHVVHGDGTSVTYLYTGRTTQAIDENGVSRISQVDGEGRLTAVCEVSTLPLQSVYPGSCAQDVGAIPASTGFSSKYAYTTDGADNQTTTVTQGQQTRISKTDSLGRPVLVTEPERGTTTYSYAYNSTGLVVTRIRPRANQQSAGVTTTTTTQYDSVGRVMSVSYNDGLTAAKTFAYDAPSGWENSSQANLKGRLSVAQAGSPGSSFSYDAAGRIVQMAECALTSGCGSTSANLQIASTYDWTGNILSAGNGDGVTTSYGYSLANEVTSITSSMSDATHPAALVSNAQNGPFGPLSYLLGNGLGKSFSYDSLGRMNGQWLCDASSQPWCGGGTGRVYGSLVNWQGTRAQSSDDTATGLNETYAYDPLNRLASVTMDAAKTTPNVTLSCDPNPLPQGTTATCTASVPGGTGTLALFEWSTYLWSVTLNSSGSAVFANIAQGSAVQSIPLTVQYSGDDNYTAGSGTTNLQVISGETTPKMTLSCGPNPVVSGAVTSCTAHVADGATGPVVFTYNGGHSWTTANVDGSGNATATGGFGGASAGSYTVAASYAGDSHFAAASASTLFTVNAGKSSPAVTFTCSPSSLDVGQTTTCTGHVSGGATGTLSLYEWSNYLWSVPLDSSGNAIFDNIAEGSPVQSIPLTVNYSGDSNFNAASGSTTITVAQGAAQTYTYVYDRYGNRWQQNLAQSGSGPQPQFTFNAANNQISTSGFAYDAAGNMTNDGSHTYTYDAEGNILQVGPGNTAAYTYDAMNRRIRAVQGSANTVYLFNASGQRVSTWNANTGAQVQGQFYWGNQPVAYYTASPSQTHFQHQDWLGTERARTTYNGAVEGQFTSLPFGDGFAVISGTDSDPYHFAGLDTDYEDTTQHAQFRNYSPAQGRWLAPDPYDGSYDLSNPQSFNRYAYVLNNPLSLTDSSGLDYGYDCGDNCVGVVGTDDNDFECWWCMEYGWPPSGPSTPYYPPNPPSKPKTPPPAPPVVPPNSTARCAAAIGDKYSLASGIKYVASALGANADNKFVNGFFGNDASAISNVFSGADPGSAAMGLAITNPTDYNAISIGVKAVGMIPNPFASQRVLLGTTSSGAYFGKEVVTPTLAESLLGDVAGGIFAEFTVGKLILDTATYGAGLVSCKLNGQ